MGWLYLLWQVIIKMKQGDIHKWARCSVHSRYSVNVSSFPIANVGDCIVLCKYCGFSGFSGFVTPIYNVILYWYLWYMWLLVHSFRKHWCVHGLDTGLDSQNLKMNRTEPCLWGAHDQTWETYISTGVFKTVGKCCNGHMQVCGWTQRRACSGLVVGWDLSKGKQMNTYCLSQWRKS